MGEADEAANVWRVGKAVDGYRLEEQIGAGELGLVFRAKHEEAGAVRAIKVLTQERASPKVIAAFCREGRTQAEVAPHPNVLRLDGSGSRHGSGYLIAELAEGGNLLDQLRARPPHPLQAAYVVSQLAKGVEHLNAAGVIHGDLKPSNVLFDRRGVPKVGDFGQGRFATSPGELSRTPYEAAPEQAADRGATLDARTDVYGLGAILFHALTGRPPFYAPHKAELLTKILEEPPTDPRELAPGVPPDLGAVCVKALAKAPDDRYPSAGAFAEALEAVVRAHAPKSAAGPPSKALKILAVGALALLVGTVGISLAWDQSRSESASPEGAAPPADDAPLDPEPAASPPSPTPPAPVDSPPEEPPPASPVLSSVWTLAVGERFRGRYRVSSKTRSTTSAGAGLPPSVSETSFEFGFRVESLDATSGQARLAVTLQSFTFSSEGGGRRKRTFSPETSGKGSPYRALLGKRFLWTVEPATGQTVKLKGLRDLQKALYLAVRDKARRRDYYVPEMTATSMTYGFDRLFYVRERDEPCPEDGWSVGESATKAVERTLTAFDAPLRGRAVRERADTPPSMRRDVTVDSVQNGSVNLSWNGAGPFRMSDGTARVSGGRVLRARVRERVIASYGDEGDTIGESVYSFQFLGAEAR